MRAQALVHVVQGLDVLRVEEVAHVEALLHTLHARVRQHHGARLLVDGVVLVALQAGDDAVDAVVLVRRLVGRARDDERGARFVDEDVVHLVDDRVMQLALYVVLQVELHVVAQVVEAELVVLAVGHVGPVGLLALFVVELVDDAADGHAQELVDASHPLSVAAGEVVVHGDDVHALARDRVQHDGAGGDERLPLAGLHFGDLARVQHHAADHLHVVMAHVVDAP